VNLDAYPKVIHVYVILLLVVSKTTPLFSNEKKKKHCQYLKLKSVYYPRRMHILLFNFLPSTDERMHIKSFNFIIIQ
jgi:hypothetical protein